MSKTTSTVPARYVADFPKLEPWLNVARALRAEATKGTTHAVVKIAVLVDEQGHPTAWTRPSATRIEPRAKGDQIDDLIRALGAD